MEGGLEGGGVVGGGDTEHSEQPMQPPQVHLSSHACVLSSQNGLHSDSAPHSVQPPQPAQLHRASQVASLLHRSPGIVAGLQAVVGRSIRCNRRSHSRCRATPTTGSSSRRRVCTSQIRQRPRHRGSRIGAAMAGAASGAEGLRRAAWRQRTSSKFTQNRMKSKHESR